MAKILDQPRYKCALAAMQTVQSIPGAIPILHSGPGCGQKLNDNSGVSGKFSPNIFPCTSVSEKEIVFGGEGKLRDTIANAIKIIDADLFVVLSGCTAEIIGDDIGSVVEEFAEADKAVIFANTPGFKGTNYLGHEWVLSSIFKQYLPAEKPETQKGLVNIFAGPPIQDPFWLGNLRQLEALAASIGLVPNTIFGHGRGVPNVDKIPAAQFNLLVSPWLGLTSVKILEEKYGTPYLHYPVLPIGAFETSKFLRAVGKFAGVDTAITERVVAEKEAEFYYYIERYSDFFLEMRIMSKRFVVLSEAQYALGITKFLVNDLGMFPTTQYITDNPPEEYHTLIFEEFRKLNYGIEAEAELFTTGIEVQEKIRNTDFGGFPLVLGSSWDREVAMQTGGIFVNISYPVVERMIINSGIVGYDGGLKFLEDIYTVAAGRLIL
ncbi:MAG: hydrogenase [Oscillospiraceae bacterium]|jgi:nitrogenase molybdenum-iron protein beta chain|nr:hydrogenase [Oscillospiraceae bacterium]